MYGLILYGCNKIETRLQFVCDDFKTLTEYLDIHEVTLTGKYTNLKLTKEDWVRFGRSDSDCSRSCSFGGLIVHSTSIDMSMFDGSPDDIEWDSLGDLEKLEDRRERLSTNLDLFLMGCSFGKEHHQETRRILEAELSNDLQSAIETRLESSPDSTELLESFRIAADEIEKSDDEILKKAFADADWKEFIQSMATELLLLNGHGLTHKAISPYNALYTTSFSSVSEW